MFTKLTTLFLFVSVVKLLAADLTPKQGLYVPDDPETYYDAGVSAVIENGKLLAVSVIYDPKGQVFGPYRFNCTGLTCVSEESAGWIITIESETKYRDDDNGDANYYFFKEPLSSEIFQHSSNVSNGKRR